MNLKFIYLSLLIALLSISKGLAQQAFMSKGVSEFYLSGASGLGSNLRAYGGEIGVTADGKVGVSVDYNQIELQNPYRASSSIASVVTVAMHKRKGKECSVVALRCGLAFNSNTPRTRGFVFGVWGMAKYRLSHRIIFSPGAGADWILLKSIPATYNSTSKITVALSGSAGFRFIFSRHSYAFLTPGIGFSEGIWIAGIQAGIGIKGVLSQKSKISKKN